MNTLKFYVYSFSFLALCVGGFILIKGTIYAISMGNLYESMENTMNRKPVHLKRRNALKHKKHQHKTKIPQEVSQI